MQNKNQISKVRSEREILVSLKNNKWIVDLKATF